MLCKLQMLSCLTKRIASGCCATAFSSLLVDISIRYDVIGPMRSLTYLQNTRNRWVQCSVSRFFSEKNNDKLLPLFLGPKKEKVAFLTITHWLDASEFFIPGADRHRDSATERCKETIKIRRKHVANEVGTTRIPNHPHHHHLSLMPSI